MTTPYQDTAIRIHSAHDYRQLVCKLLMMLNELEILAIESDRDNASAPHHQTRLHAR